MLDDRMNRAPSPAIIHVRLRCWVAWMAAGTLRGGSSRWAASAHPALAVQGGQVQPILRSVRGSLPCGFFAYNINLGVTFCAMMFVIRACFYGCFSVGMWCLRHRTFPVFFWVGRLTKFSFREVPFSEALV